ncbi:PTS sugar transporter subunit IIC [Lederbergia sp. NSJ-179]|uniref:PTS mannose/fructose/sorbose/N-acetylgalactosamine transporter subunit IIC n=1 Tax=Lederbergia sp. NSJ-179 TaxID=2931402 RepID=UPI001FD18B58|nr:PTS sugar transporter subunit IIC [Lederbergia sp. NSJ-179]MCJ7843338.1 PTS sugar transporter subunit IIC [Lederbergia sp. NSJ-179]
MIIKALLVSIIAGIGEIDNRILGMTMIQRPIIMSTLVGLVYGDVVTAMIIGAQIELLSMGIVGIGAHSAPPDVTLGSALCTAFALGSGTGTEVALALALPVSAFATSLKYVTYVPLNHMLSERARKKAAVADTKAMGVSQWLGLFNYFIFPFIITFIAMMLGGPLFEDLVEVTPKAITEGIQVAAGLLPALGFALLMRLTYTKQYAPYLFLGFVCVAFLGMSNVGVAAIGAIIAVLIFSTDNQSNGKEAALDDNEV